MNLNFSRGWATDSYLEPSKSDVGII